MSWTTGTLINGYDTVLYVQDAGVTAAPGTADEVPFGTEFTWTTEKQSADKGPHINSSSIRKTITGIGKSGSLTIDIHSAANSARNRLMTAVTSTSARVKFTLWIGGTTNGEKHVWDQVLVGNEGNVNPAEGIQYTFPWEADSYAHTAGTFA